MQKLLDLEELVMMNASMHRCTMRQLLLQCITWTLQAQQDAAGVVFLACSDVDMRMLWRAMRWEPALHAGMLHLGWSTRNLNAGIALDPGPLHARRQSGPGSALQLLQRRAGATSAAVAATVAAAA
jgi:hypothetical protein